MSAEFHPIVDEYVAHLPDEEHDAVADIHDHVYEMFCAQNSIIDMDRRWEITNLSFDGDDETKALIADYAAKVEAFVKYVSENPDTVARSLSILKGEEVSRVAEGR